jgi:hypothetical protein
VALALAEEVLRRGDRAESARCETAWEPVRGPLPTGISVKSSQIIHLNRLSDSESPLEARPMLALDPVSAPLPSLRLLAHGGKV